MIRSRSAQVIAALATSLALAFVVAVSSSSHEVDDDEEFVSTDGRGPDLKKPIALPRTLAALEISLGLIDAGTGEWDGEVKVSEGRVVDVAVVRAGTESTADGPKFSVGAVAKKAAAKKQNAKKQKNQQKQKQAQAKKKQQGAAGAILRAIVDVPEKATVTVATSKGEFAFALADLAGGRKTFLDGNAAVERQVAGVRMTGPVIEDDFPASAKGADGSIWLASVEYRPEQAMITAKAQAKGGEAAKPKAKAQPALQAEFEAAGFDRLVPTHHGDRIRLRRFDGKAWLPAISVTAGGLDVWRPSVAVDGQGVVWVAWAQKVDGDWEIFRRGYTPPKAGQDQGTWSEAIRVTETPGTDFHVVAATDSKGVVWLAWQGRRKDNYDIWVSAQQAGHPWNAPRAISDSPANDWCPAIAADARGNVHVAWDTYDQGNFDVRLRTVAGPGEAPTRSVAASSRFEGRPHLACDRDGRVWIAYEEGDEQWGKDYAHAGPVQDVGLEKNPGFALYVNRTVKVKCLADGRLSRPAGTLEKAFAGRNDRNKSLPRLAAGEDGSVWLTFRHHPGQGGGEVWVGSVMRYDGKRWSAPTRLADSANLLDNRPALTATEGGVVMVYSGDGRNNTQNRKQDDLFTAFLSPEGPASPAPDLADDSPAPAAELATVHAEETADIARMRSYRIEAGGKPLRLLRGEFHRHTEFSSHNDQDGLLEDAWRYALDAVRHDWMGDGDHDNGFGHEYMWWIIQKMTDIHHNPPYFVGAMTYERSVVYPNGHRNVMMPKRGIRPLPRGVLDGTPEAGTPDTKLLYTYLKHFGGICASHTSATNMGTDWRDNDPQVEPVVEIFQGHRHNYETPGAPRSPTAETQIGGFQPAGFIWNALGKGYRLGFQSSSDHVSTHMSYAVVLTDDSSRQGIIDAFKKRHSYAATDNIILDVRSGEHLMGDAFETAAKPTLAIAAQGTAAIARVHVIRDNAYVFSTEPNQRAVSLNYTDDNAEPGTTHYYYVRIQQADGNLAWASPMWITYKK